MRGCIASYMFKVGFGINVKNEHQIMAATTSCWLPSLRFAVPCPQNPQRLLYAYRQFAKTYDKIVNGHWDYEGALSTIEQSSKHYGGKTAFGTI